MSLLMEALKKAEEEKKEASKRLNEADHEQSSVHDDTELLSDENRSDAVEEAYAEPLASKRELRLEPISQQAAHEPGHTPRHEQGHEPGHNQGPGAPPSQTTAPVAATELLAEPIPAEVEIQQTQNISSADLNTDSTLMLNEAEAEAVADTVSDTATDKDYTEVIAVASDEDAYLPGADQTIHDIGLVNQGDQGSLAAHIEQVADGTILTPADFSDTVFQQTDNYEETLAGVSAEQLSEDTGVSDLPTPVAAQTIFAASGRHKKTGVNWLLYGSLPLVLIIIAGAIYIYIARNATVQTNIPTAAIKLSQQAAGTDILPVTEFIAAPEVVDAELAVTDNTDSLSSGLADADVVKPMAASDASRSATAESVNSAAQKPDAVAVAAAEEATPHAAETVAVSPAVSEQISETEKDIGPSQQQTVTTANVSAPLSLAARLDAYNSGLETRIEISKSIGIEEEAQAIKQAYDAYQNNRLTEAKARYQEVLQRYPDNRDALLGLAAVAIKESDRDTAVAIYTHLLSLNPQDGVAMTALIGLQNKQLASKGESDIKNVLFEQPDNHFLHFTLGKIYAAQGRWSDAQQAFFDAYGLNAGNPAYALNLAISLDRLSQTKAALEYYTLALSLAGQSHVKIDTVTVQNRIQFLSTQVQP